MMNRPLIDARMLDRLHRFFPDLATVEEVTEVRDAMGFPTETWANLPGHVDLPARIGETSAEERMATDSTYASATHKCLLRGHYPAIHSGNRLVSGGVVYDITGAESNPEETITRLRLTLAGTQG